MSHVNSQFVTINIIDTAIDSVILVLAVNSDQPAKGVIKCQMSTYLNSIWISPNFLIVSMSI